MTQRLWCWRCHGNVWMLDKNEFEELQRLAGADSLLEPDVFALQWLMFPEDYQDARGFLESLIGEDAIDAHALRHHRADLYGSPCTVCGKVLRSPKARLCFECGASR